MTRRASSGSRESRRYSSSTRNRDHSYIRVWAAPSSHAPYLEPSTTSPWVRRESYTQAYPPNARTSSSSSRYYNNPSNVSTPPGPTYASYCRSPSVPTRGLPSHARPASASTPVVRPGRGSISNAWPTVTSTPKAPPRSGGPSNDRQTGAPMPTAPRLSKPSRMPNIVSLCIRNSDVQWCTPVEASRIQTSAVLRRQMSPSNNPEYPLLVAEIVGPLYPMDMYHHYLTENKIAPLSQMKGRWSSKEGLSQWECDDLIACWRFGQQLEDEIFQDRVISNLMSRLREPGNETTGTALLKTLKSSQLIRNIWDTNNSEPFQKFVVDVIARYRTEADAKDFVDTIKYPVGFLSELYIAEVEAKPKSSRQKGIGRKVSFEEPLVEEFGLQYLSSSFASTSAS
ncbi:hypothetical protein CC80DRAFT_531114 [Byssothecium circinans]|uniref:Uncharacterized protein n=1 Tax=Byssothecium circinans TaxID=147558 RepID=A0A6A5UDW5_9PLEO|nr:hypothetical protein CC80DRAFT_531114 [Byssothecium circinans]